MLAKYTAFDYLNKKMNDTNTKSGWFLNYGKCEVRRAF